MANIKSVIAVLTVAAQVIGIASIAFMSFDFLTSADVLVEQSADDIEVLGRLISEKMASYRPFVSSGIIGAIFAWLLILKGKYWAPWYLKTCRIIAWIWLPLIPVGSVIGALILSARAAALESRKAT